MKEWSIISPWWRSLWAGVIIKKRPQCRVFLDNACYWNLVTRIHWKWKCLLKKNMWISNIPALENITHRNIAHIETARASNMSYKCFRMAPFKLCMCIYGWGSWGYHIKIILYKIFQKYFQHLYSCRDVHWYKRRKFWCWLPVTRNLKQSSLLEKTVS